MLDIKPLEPKFLPKDLTIATWDDVKPYADDLLNRQWHSVAEFERWLQDWSEMQTIVGQVGSWCSIKTTLNTVDEQAKAAYDNFLKLISTETSKLDDALQRRALGSPYAQEFKQPGFEIALKRWQASVDLYRVENIPLSVEDGIKNRGYGKIRGAASVNLDGEDLTLQQAAARLEWQDRAKREEAWRAGRERTMQDKSKLDDLMGELIALRHKIALQADCANFRDYKFKQLQRFDYTPKDCFAFHEAVEREVLPVVKMMYGQRAKSLGLEMLRPWDLSCDPLGRTGLKAFANAEELIDKSIGALGAIDEDFAATVIRMKERNYLDLESRPNKAPGAYNSRLDVERTSFMFGNVTGLAHDMTTFMHEAGHAAHNIMMRHLALRPYRAYTMEVAELASMSMELLTGEEWRRFFPDETDYRRARLDHLQDRIEVLVHIARIDAFQHKLYENPDMTAEERHDAYDALQKRFDTGWIDWSGLEQYRRTAWHWQMHIFEVPFYYIEYGIAQIGAFQVWRNYQQDPKRALQQYKDALSLGYTKPVPEIYQTAGIKFDFSAAMLKELMEFVQKEMTALV